MLLIGVITIFAVTSTAYREGTGREIDASQKLGLRRLLMVIAIPSFVTLAVLIGGGWFYSEQKQSIRKEIEGQLTSILRSKVNQITARRERPIGVVVPLFAGNGHVKQPIGAAIMIIDANKFLYPLIQSWPVLSKTAETLLVRRDGDNVLFLNELRHQHGTALKLRIPLTKTNVPAVMAVLGRKSGMEESKDYRGVNVVSVFQPVPDSPWFIVAKIDAAEVFANWQFRAGTILALIISLIIIAGSLGFILWQRSEKALYGALRESEERTRTITDSAHDAITMMDNDGNISYWNPAAKQILGYTSAEAIGRNLHKLIAPERFLPAHLAAFPEFQQTGQGNAIGKTLELSARRKDGREIDIALSLSAVKIKSAWHAVGIIQDITERKNAEKKLARVSLQNELILKSAAEGILGLDLQGNHTFVNSAAARMLGYEAEELIGRPSHSTWHHTRPDGSPYPQEDCEILKAHIEGEVYRVSTEIFWRKDGTSFPVEYASTPIYEQGRTTGVVLNFTDITERKQNEEALRKSEERFKQLAEIFPETIFEANMQGDVTYANEHGLNRFGYTKEDIAKGLNLFNMISANDRSLVLERILNRIQGTGKGYLEYQAMKKDGSTFYVMALSAPIMVDGIPVGIRGFIIDITERKKAEEQIKYLATHDLLTDLPSLRLAKDRLFIALNMARRYKKAVAVMFIDLDGFKDVNDTLGHEAGDYVLQQVAKRMLSCVRETDTVARIGGDEFLIIATEIKAPENVAQIAEKVIQQVSKPFIFKGRKAFVGASIGIALFPDHGKDMDHLIKKADEAMYKIKNAGKNGFLFVDTAIK